MKKYIIIFCFLVGINIYVKAQTNTIAPFQDEINAFAKADSLEKEKF